LPFVALSPVVHRTLCCLTNSQTSGTGRPKRRAANPCPLPVNPGSSQQRNACLNCERFQPTVNVRKGFGPRCARTKTTASASTPQAGSPLRQSHIQSVGWERRTELGIFRPPWFTFPCQMLHRNYLFLNSLLIASRRSNPTLTISSQTPTLSSSRGTMATAYLLPFAAFALCTSSCVRTETICVEHIAITYQVTNDRTNEVSRIDCFAEDPPQVCETGSCSCAEGDTFCEEVFATREAERQREEAERRRSEEERRRSNCCRICDRGKACGDGCISEQNTCRTSGGCACNR